MPKRLLVVSRPQFREGLQPFVQWKRQEGYDVVELYATTHRRDSVKALVAPYFAASPLQSVEPWPTHLLLVGDVEQLQAYIGGTDRPEGLGAHVTDLYYAEHTGDYLPDAQVGRWPVGDTAELRAVVEKTLRYEQGLGLDTAVLRRVLLVAGAESSNPAPVTTNGQVNYVGSELVLTHPGIDTVCFHNPQSASQGPAIVQQIAAGASLLNFTAHCNEAGWTSPQLRFTSVDTIVGSQPLFYINNCCKSNDYSATGFGELLLRKADGGAVGVIGATNSTLWSEDYYWAVGPKYPLSVNPQYDSLRPGAFDRWTGRLGGVATAGALLQAGNLAVSASGSPYSRFYWEIYCLLGDPLMRPYVGVPAWAMLSAADTVEAGGTTLTVTATPGATVSAVQDSVLLGTATASATGSATLSLRQSMAVGRLLVTATGAALLPAVDTVVATAPQRGLALGHPAATDSTVHFTLANLGADTLGAVAVTLQQDSVDLALGAPLVVGPLAIGPLAPHAVVPVSLPYSVAMAGPRPQWHATLVATADTLRCAVALGRALVPDYPTVALDLLDTDGQAARSLEAGGEVVFLHRFFQIVHCMYIIQIQLLQQGIVDDRHGRQKGEVRHIRLDRYTLRKFHWQFFRLCFPVCCIRQAGFQTVCHTRHGITDHDGLVAGIDQLSVRDRHISYLIIFQRKSREYQERLTEHDGLSVHIRLFLFMIDIGKVDLQVAALSRKFIRLHRISVQRIGDLGRDRQFLVRFPLIINILAVSLPDHPSVVVFREGLFALYIFHIRQLRAVRQGRFFVRILQPDTGDFFFCTAAGICHDIDSLLTFRIFLPGRKLLPDCIYESFCLLLIRFSGLFL